MNWLTNIFSQSDTKYQTLDASPTFPHVVWIHGANQSSLSFKYILDHFPNIQSTMIEYSSNNGFFNNLADIVNTLKDTGPVFVVGHSLGGLYALHLTKYIDVVGGVTISTPYGGSSVADWVKYFLPRYQLFRDIGTRSKPIVEASTIYPKVPWTQIISTSGGVPWHDGPNDSVVTIASMEKLDDRMEIFRVPVNHYEIICCDATIEILTKKICCK
jgi:pimeloyl-ACP methyl ester carboxylesterase